MDGSRIGRTEVEREVPVAGAAAQLYASSGPRDDYAELVMPADWRPDETLGARLAALSRAVEGRSEDLSLISGPPWIVAATVLRVGDLVDRSRSVEDRLLDLLRDLARAIPEADFGDLLPREPAVEIAATTEGELATAAAAVEAAGEIIAESTRAVRPYPAASVDDLLARAAGHVSKGQAHKASRLVDEALRLSPRHLGVAMLRARLALLGRREKKRQRDPHSPWAQLELGMSYLQLDCDSLAVAAFREAARLAPRNYLAHLLLGVACHRQGRPAEARAAYDAAGRLRPDDSAVGDLLETLAMGEPLPLPVEDDLPVSSRATPAGRPMPAGCLRYLPIIASSALPPAT